MKVVEKLLSATLLVFPVTHHLPAKRTHCRVKARRHPVSRRNGLACLDIVILMRRNNDDAPIISAVSITEHLITSSVLSRARNARPLARA